MLELVGNILGHLGSQGPAGHTYPGHVGGVAGLVVCQVSGMVAAAGHGEDAPAGYPPPLGFRSAATDASLRRAGRWREGLPRPP